MAGSVLAMATPTATLARVRVVLAMLATRAPSRTPSPSRDTAQSLQARKLWATMVVSGPMAWAASAAACPTRVTISARALPFSKCSCKCRIAHAAIHIPTSRRVRQCGARWLGRQQHSHDAASGLQAPLPPLPFPLYPPPQGSCDSSKTVGQRFQQGCIIRLVVTAKGFPAFTSFSCTEAVGEHLFYSRHCDSSSCMLRPSSRARAHYK